MVAIAIQKTKRQKSRRRFPPILCVVISILTILWIVKTQILIENDESMKQQQQSFIRVLPSTKLSAKRFHFFKTYNPFQQPPASDLAELRHCNLQNLDWNDYLDWSSFILDAKMPQFRENAQYANFSEWKSMEEEFCLQLLEMYATFHGSCKFDTGYPFVPSSIPPASTVFPQDSNNNNNNNDQFATCAVVISAFTDAPQLQRLITSIYMPQHFIVIHVERRSSPEFLSRVKEIAAPYPNIKVVQFSTIIYRTDLISHVNLQLLKWFMDSSLKFHYYICINGASFSLSSAKELARFLYKSNRKVWLGELTHGRDGSLVRTSQAGLLVGAKRLAYTRGNTTKGTFRISQSLVEQDGKFQMQISPEIVETMSRKTVSGNQAVYSFSVVEKLLASPKAMQLFAHAKYACCGVLEELTWIAALRLEFGDSIENEALHEAGCMWQTWGGQTTCQSSVNNAILTTNASICYKVEDATMERRNNASALYIYGNEIMNYLVNAKKRGFLFARKFSSDNAESMALLQDIQNELHDKH